MSWGSKKTHKYKRDNAEVLEAINEDYFDMYEGDYDYDCGSYCYCDYCHISMADIKSGFLLTLLAKLGLRTPKDANHPWM